MCKKCFSRSGIKSYWVSMFGSINQMWTVGAFLFSVMFPLIDKDTTIEEKKETRNSKFHITHKNLRLLKSSPRFLKYLKNKHLFHWPELVTVILNFLNIFRLRNTATQFILMFQKIGKKINQKTLLFLVHFVSLKVNYRLLT